MVRHTVRLRSGSALTVALLLSVIAVPGSVQAQASNTIQINDPELAIVGVRDEVPDGAPSQRSPHPLPRREFTSRCGPSSSGRPPHNLLRWAFDRDLGFPVEGFDLYRCCGRGSTPPPGDPGWEKLNVERIRPPRNDAEGDVFVTGLGALPDQGRNVIAARVTPEEWASYCHLLREVTAQPVTCPPLPPPPAEQMAGDPTLEIAEDPMASLMLASLRPEIATLLGLYWVDDQGDGEDCFYRLEGFWSDQVRQAVTGPVIAATLPFPEGLELSQSPPENGESCAELGGPGVARSGPAAAGIQLRWLLPEPVLWSPPAETPITYNVCRLGPAETRFTQVNTAEYDDPATGTATVEAPVLVPRVPVFNTQGEPTLDANGHPETKAPDDFYDDPLRNPEHQGVYSYKITGMDIFGRESQPSLPAARQWIDSRGPPAIINLQAATELTLPPTSPASSTVTLAFDWTREQAVLAPDVDHFRVYRRLDSPDLEDDALGCPVALAASADWVAVGNAIAHGAFAALYDAGNPLPTEDIPILGEVLPVRRYQLMDALQLPTGPPVRHVYYRVVAVDAAGNLSAPSGPARGHVIDNQPASPPASMRAVFSQSEWDDTVQAHLLWPPTGEIMGYKLLRSARRPMCASDADCPLQNCRLDGQCDPIPCLPTSDPGVRICGGDDLGPSDSRGQEDREANLTQGVDPYHRGAVVRQLAKLQSLAELGNLWQRDNATGAPVLVAPSCRLPAPAITCRDDLLLALGAANTQYRQDVLPQKATEQVFFYRVMAVSRAGIQETLDALPGSAGPVSIAFPFRIPDFVAPSAVELASVFAHVQDPQDPADVDAVEIAWPVGPESDAHRNGAGYTVWRADVGGAATNPPVLAANTGSFIPEGLDPESCYRFDVRRADDQGQPDGPSLASGVMIGSAPREIVWLPPAGSTQVTIEHRNEALQTLHSDKFLPAVAAQTVGDLVVLTDNPSALTPTLRVRDQPPEAERDYCYAVQLTDLAGNASAFSAPLLGRRLDTTAPDPPSGLGVSRVGDEAHLRWSHAEPGLAATVKRSSVGAAGPWRTLAAKTSPGQVPDETTIDNIFDSWLDAGSSEYRFRDFGTQPGRSYWYRVELFDAAGNKSSRDDGKIELGEGG